MNTAEPLKSLLGGPEGGGTQGRALVALDGSATHVASAIRRAVPYLMRRSTPILPKAARVVLFRALTEELSGPIYSVPLATDPGGSRAVLALDRAAVTYLLEGALGGDPEDPLDPANQDITGPERAVLSRIIEGIVRAVSDSLSTRGIRLRRLPEAPGTAPDGPVASISFVVGKESKGTIVLGISPDALLQGGAQTTPSQREPDTQARTQAVLSNVHVELVVELGRLSRRLVDLDALKVGDVLRLGTHVSAPVHVCIQGKPIYRGRPSTAGTCVAVTGLERVASLEELGVVVDDLADAPGGAPL
jgi:flagellar motor switch protein FliM